MAKALTKSEVTTTHMATLAAKTLLNPNATSLEKKLAGALLNQAADKLKTIPRK